MKTKYAEDLAKDYEFNTAEEYYQYIIDSLINGNREQMKDLFLKMEDYDKERFLVDFCDAAGLIGRSVKNICIGTLLKY